MADIPRILAAFESATDAKVTRAEPIIDAAPLVEAVVPHFGALSWMPPPSYRAALAAWGPFAALREDVATGANKGFTLVGDDAIGSLNEDLVHMPEGVSRDDGVTLTTNHLVGFAEAGGEAVWCFDVTKADANGEYPIYYHHQDEPRARLLHDGAPGPWENPDDATPDFASFRHWLEAMAVTMTMPTPPPFFERLGRPGLSFHTIALALES